MINILFDFVTCKQKIVIIIEIDTHFMVECIVQNILLLLLLLRAYWIFVNTIGKRKGTFDPCFVLEVCQYDCKKEKAHLILSLTKWRLLTSHTKKP
jgi:hypothetical protein